MPCSISLFFGMIPPVPFVVGSCKHDGEIGLALGALKFFDDCGAAGGKLIKDQWLKPPTTEHGLKFCPSLFRVPINDEHLARQQRNSRRSRCRFAWGRRRRSFKKAGQSSAILALDYDPAGVINANDLPTGKPELITVSVRKRLLRYDLMTVGRQERHRLFKIHQRSDAKGRISGWEHIARWTSCHNFKH